MKDIYFGCICATYNRPTLLPEAVESFLRQSYTQAELIVLDDSGQYEEQEGCRWKLFTHPKKFETLGAKFDYCIRNLISPKVNAIAIWDDDDISLPNRLEVVAKYLKKNDVALPWTSVAWDENGNAVTRHSRWPIHKGGYRLETYLELGGYSHNADNWEDLELWNRFVASKKRTSRIGETIYITRRHRGVLHVSGCKSMNEYQNKQIFSNTKIEKVVPHWNLEYDLEVANLQTKRISVPEIGTIVDGFTQHGSIGVNGSLGYEGGIVIPPPGYEEWKPISAHASSEIVMDFDSSTEIFGCVNATMAALRQDNPIYYLVDGDVIGEVAGPWDSTRSLILPSGKHRLGIDAGRTNGNCHTLWMCRKADREAATMDNTAFLTVAAFNNNPNATKMFRRSAEHHGVNVCYLDEGKSWYGSYEHKIRRIKDRLVKLREQGKEYVFIPDSRDVVFVDDLSTILGKFNAMNTGKAIFNMDVFCQAWPHLNSWYLRELQKVMGHHSANLNSGLVASKIETLYEIFGLIDVLHNEFVTEKPRKGIMERLYRETGTRYANRDQVMYQLCMAYYPEYFEVDTEKSLFALIVDWPKKPLRFTDDPRRNDVICNASILHSPNLSRHGDWGKWWNENKWTRVR